jgi:hypothetical protein
LVGPRDKQTRRKGSLLTGLIFQKALHVPFCHDSVLMDAQQVLKVFGSLDKAGDGLSIADFG